MTDRFDEEEKAFFKEKLSANHRALIESLLNLCDGNHTVDDIALRLSLDLGRVLPVGDVVRGVGLLEKAGYLAS